ncbi:MNS2 [Symbiodinium microadriaticum]|nr:MNS2 [Symbiodinium microadriaticum]
MYDKAMDGVVNILLKASQSGLAFLSDWDGHNNHLKMDHLVCFMPGLMTLGAYTDPLGLESARAQRDLAVAKALMYTCREMYHRTATGIAPEFVTFDSRNDMNTHTSAKFYILRPETAESLFIMNQLTGDPIYREWAWEIWSAIDRHCRKGSGFASLQDVNNAQSPVDNRMESFFLAETMKYLYLAQDPDNEIDLMKYVFNTEAHPMKIFEKGSHKAVPAS